mmetsp:Transcript_58175/g.185209  ORF Transcript_58175/g.185209 Transcript_58175/m.185209 type:complete len:388 (-) Transcript_58175:1190-2353(-)
MALTCHGWASHPAHSTRQTEAMATLSQANAVLSFGAAKATASGRRNSGVRAAAMSVRSSSLMGTSVSFPIKAARAGTAAGRGMSTEIKAASADWRPSWGPSACHNGAFLTPAEKIELERVCALIGTPGKGITACDEGPATIGSRFEAVGIENTEENRRAYRQMLFEAPGAADYLSAAILDPETLYQTSSTSGKLFPETLKELGIVPGVKPHLKVYALPGQDGATVMQGLDSLAARCKEFKDAGCQFAKWRSPITIDLATGQPSDLVIEANMRDLARYALICQAEGLVPIVEPDVSLTGEHDLETAVRINVKIQAELFHQMLLHGVFMEGALLKSNMINPGKKCPTPYTVEEIAQANIDQLNRVFPCAMKSANYLSGGQSLEDAAARL